jgi:hypothetical protein
MFFFSKKAASRKSADPAAPSNIPVHTMQDDLDRLEGNIDLRDDSDSAPAKASSADVAGAHPLPGPIAAPSPEPKAAPRGAANPFGVPETTPIVPRAEAPRRPIDPATTSAPSEKGPLPETTHHILAKPFARPEAKPATPPTASQKWEAPASVEVPGKEQYISDSNVTLEPEKGSRLGLALAIAAVVLIFAGGGYYFWTTRGLQNDIADKTPANNRPENPDENTVPGVLFATDKPNYLPVAPGSADPSGVRSLLSTTGQKVSSSGAGQAIEFFVTDEDNNSASFETFAQWSDVRLPEELLANLSGKFSLYMYNDKGSVRLGLALETSQPQAAKAVMQKNEIGLTSLLKPLFLEIVSLPESASFKDSTYKNNQVRYLNLDQAKAYSIDYAVTPTHVIIATSKDTGRAIIDMVTK